MTANNNLLAPGQQIKASMDKKYAKSLVELRYGFTVESIVELDAYDDRNYHVLCKDGTQEANPHVSSIAKNGYVLKIINSLDSRKTAFIEAQNELLIFLNTKGIVCSVPVKQKDGSYYSIETLEKNGQRHAMRLLYYIPGEVLSKVSISTELLTKVGSFAARLDKVLQKFSHPGYDNQTSLWILSEVPKLRDFYFAVENKSHVDLVENIIKTFEQKVLGIASSFDKGIIHGDLNESNIIVSSDGKEVEAIIDFGDSHISCFIFELAICICYMITETNNISMGKFLIEGYRTIRQLSQPEKDVLKLCVCARLAQSVVLGAYSHQKEPSNHYLVRNQEVKWSLIKKLWSISDDEIMTIWGITN